MTDLGRRRDRGFTMVEVLIALAIGSLVIAAIWGITSTAIQTREISGERLRLIRDGDFAMERIVRMVRRSPGLVLPQADRPATPQDESVRDLLVVLLDRDLDRDGDGFPDVDDDRDGRIDEDPGADMNGDGEPGIADVDDDLDGMVDEGLPADDDEDGMVDEELPNGIDDDLDGLIDEDLAADLDQDGAPGRLGVDDDEDGAIDESADVTDDDEDEDAFGANEDGFDPIRFHLDADLLKVTAPTPHSTATSTVVLIEDVVEFRIVRLPRTPSQRADMVEILLRLAGDHGAQFEVLRRIRVGGLL